MEKKKEINSVMMLRWYRWEREKKGRKRERWIKTKKKPLTFPMNSVIVLRWYQGGLNEFSIATQRGGNITKSATAVPGDVDWKKGLRTYNNNNSIAIISLNYTYTDEHLKCKQISICVDKNKSRWSENITKSAFLETSTETSCKPIIKPINRFCIEWPSNFLPIIRIDTWYQIEQHKKNNRWLEWYTTKYMDKLFFIITILSKQKERLSNSKFFSTEIFLPGMLILCRSKDQDDHKRRCS